MSMTSREPDVGAPEFLERSSEVAERTGFRRLAAGGGMLALAMMLANAGNYLLNIGLGRWLTPAEFADANLMVTLMLVITAAAISLQLIAARFAGMNSARGTDDQTNVLSHWLERRAIIAGIALALVFAAGAPLWRAFFHTESAVPFVILGLGMPFYLAQAVGRGVLQGQLRFGPLAMTFAIEMVVRVGLGAGLVAAGFGVVGATTALTASFVATWVSVRLVVGSGRTGRAADDLIADVLAYASPIGVMLAGQIIINNGDVLVAKRYFDADIAGVYAAVALIGRAVFFLSWTVATTLFPAVAQREEGGQGTNGLLFGGVAVVAVLGFAMVVAAALLGDSLLVGLFGDAYGSTGSLLTRYAFATSVFAVANLIVSHHLSAGETAFAWLLIAGAAIQTALLLVMRSEPATVVNAQVIAMVTLLAVVVGVHHWHARRPSTKTELAESASVAHTQLTRESRR